MLETELLIKINANHDADMNEVAELTRTLRNDILETNAENAEFVTNGKALSGTKSADPVTWGTILVTLAASGGVLTTLINVISSWLSRNKGNSIILEIDGDKLEVTGLSSEEQQRLISLWLNRHRGFVLPND
ncbi:MAG: hypothetical protein H6657_11380 [Ardenticatenaceae bacterium]|nr:hypothetical protein [Ardenticatenaceae bacterium]